MTALAEGYRKPLVARFVFGEDLEWPGWTWFFVDMVVFWSGLGVGILLAQIGLEDSD